MKRDLTIKEYQKVLDNIADGVFVIDPNGIVLVANKAVELNGGKKVEEILGRNIVELENEGYCTEFVSKRVIKSKNPETALQRTKDNRELLVTGNPCFDENGMLTMVIASERDVTELSKVKQNLLKVKSINKKYQDELEKLRIKNGHYADKIFVSSKMKSVVSLAQRAAITDATILIQGDSGTGKEVMANMIYSESLRNENPFIKVNCGAIPENLIESEFFGYVGGAFTGALKGGKIGFFEMANGGTLFLDEVGDIPLSLQVKFLRVLQEREMIPVGGTKPVKLDIRIIAATNKPLKKLVDEGKFRQDLYYRLGVVIIDIAPLKERKEDILALAQRFIIENNRRYGYNIKFSNKAKKLMLEYDWPGNVRELENVIESLMVTAEDELITESNMKKYISMTREISEADQGDPQVGNVPIEISGSLTEMIESYEKEILEKLIQDRWSTTDIAKMLKTSKSTINRKIAKYNIK